MTCTACAIFHETYGHPTPEPSAEACYQCGEPMSHRRHRGEHPFIEPPGFVLGPPTPEPSAEADAALEPVDIEVRHPVGAVLSVRVPGAMAVELDAEARTRGVKMSDVIREALERRNGPWTSATVPAVNVSWQAPATPPLDVERLHEAMYGDGCITPPYTEHVAHVIAALANPEPSAEADRITPVGYVPVRMYSGGVLADGTTNTEPIDFLNPAPEPSAEADAGRWASMTPQQQLDAYRAALSRPATPPPGTRLVLASVELLDTLGTRDADGNRLSFVWGDPDEHGWYTPTITVHYDDNLRPATQPLDVELVNAALKFYAEQLPGYAASAGLTQDEFAAVMVDVNKVRAALASPDPETA